MDARPLPLVMLCRDSEPSKTFRRLQLPQQLQTELQLPRGIRLGCDLTEGRRRDARSRRAEARRVERVQRLDPELHAHPFDRRELFEQ